MIHRQRNTLKNRTFTPNSDTYRTLTKSANRLRHMAKPLNDFSTQLVTSLKPILRSNTSLRNLHTHRMQTVGSHILHTQGRQFNREWEGPQITLRKGASFGVVFEVDEQQLQFSSTASTIADLTIQTKKMLVKKKMKVEPFVLASQEGELAMDYFLTILNSSTTEFNGKKINLKPYYTSIQSQVNLNSFQIIKCIGSGGFSKVFLVRFKGDGCFYAMKVISKAFIAKHKKEELVLNQREVMVHMSHPMHSKLHWAFQSPNSIILVMEYYPGGQLFGLIKRFRRMNEGMARFYMVGVLLALQKLHEAGVAYRDIKPENILLDKEGHVHLSDFGLVKTGLKSDTSRAYSFCGSPEYMPPEIIARKGHTLSADFYSLGALLFELVTGLPPFYSRNPEKIYTATLKQKMVYPSHLSSELKSLLEGLLCKQHQNRLGSRYGVKQILSHPWFAQINPNDYLTKKCEPPTKFTRLEDLRLHEEESDEKNQQLLQILKKQQSNHSHFPTMLQNFNFIDKNLNNNAQCESVEDLKRGKNLNFLSKLKRRTQEGTLGHKRQSKLNNFM